MGHEQQQSHENHANTQEVKADIHEVKAEMMTALSPYYNHHDMSLFGKISHYFSSLIEAKHHSHIDSKSYEEKELNQFSERKHVSRTVFALKKIRTFNHAFFSEDEEKILDPLPLGLVTYGMKYFFCGVDAAILTYMWRNWNFNFRTSALVCGLLAFQSFTLHIPNLTNEVLIQTPRRHALAKRYIEHYGPELFHNILNPNYDLDHLKHLQNKLNPY